MYVFTLSYLYLSLVPGINDLCFFRIEDFCQFCELLTLRNVMLSLRCNSCKLPIDPLMLMSISEIPNVYLCTHFLEQLYNKDIGPLPYTIVNSSCPFYIDINAYVLVTLTPKHLHCKLLHRKPLKQTSHHRSNITVT